MIRTTTRGIALAFACPALIPADATAQYWSLGFSIGGGTIAAIHGGMHLVNTDGRRESGLTGGRTEIELVIGFRSLRTGVWDSLGRQQNRASPTLGLNVRRTHKESRLSAGLGFRFAPAPSDRVGGYHTVFHLPIGYEPYPYLRVRLFVYPGLGKRAPPPGGNGPPSKWRFYLPRPQLQIDLKHT